MTFRTAFAPAVGFNTGLAMGLLLITPHLARCDVDLVTVPRREATQLTIYNSEDITMVREHRLLTIKPGVNRIQFSWANTLIDPTSIDFRILAQQDQVDLIDTTFPAGRNDSLQWNIESRISGKIPVEIRYFTSGITWSAKYMGIANQDETRLHLTGFVTVDNQSGEKYDHAQTRLVVGTINLVEKIADLAQRPVPATRFYAREAGERQKMRSRFSRALGRAGGFGGGGFGDSGDDTPDADKAKEVIKEGLSEYFLFTIEGREDIQDKEPKRLICLEVDDVPLECLYKLSDREGGRHFTKYYRFKNLKLTADGGLPKEIPDAENLGTSPLPDGEVRLYSEYENQDLAYVGGTTVKYVPIGDRVEVNVGRDNSITMTRRLKDQRTSNFVARQYERRLNDEFVWRYDLVDYDETFFYEEEVVSGKTAEVKVEIERSFDANVVVWSGDDQPTDWSSNDPGAYVDLHKIAGRVERVDDKAVKYFLDLEPGKKTIIRYSVTYKRRRVGPELNTEKIRRRL